MGFLFNIRARSLQDPLTPVEAPTVQEAQVFSRISSVDLIATALWASVLAF